jgi:asparagine synthase (glutamine-hydrolysing)
MCGIAGIINTNQSIDSSLVNKISQFMIHRGPDAEGLFAEGPVLLAHRRLSIIDPGVQANQPFYSQDGRYVLVYNGELYNYKSLRAELRAYDFLTNSDTEVVLAAFQAWGISCMERFEGMFAFAIWDKVSERLIMGRDRLGIKPLYYYISDQHLIFASEVRSILSSGLVAKILDKRALGDYIQYHTVHAPNTLIKDIYQLPAAHLAIYDKGELTLIRYWQAGGKKEYTKLNRTAALSTFRELFFDSVEQRMLSDVPIAAFLSGGIDSSAVVAAMAQRSSKAVDAFSVGFSEKDYDESAYSKMVADQFSCKHHLFQLRADDFLSELPESFQAVDHPSSDGINVYLISKLIAKQGIKVALSGLGGDELFGGYAVFGQMQRLNQFKAFWNLPQGLRKPLGFLVNRVFNDHRGARLQAILSADSGAYLDLYPELGKYSTREQIKATGISPHNKSVENYLNLLGFDPSWSPMTQVSFGELYRYASSVLLRDSDQMGMANSLEIRVPFMDHKLVDFVLSLDDSIKQPYPQPKQFLIDSMEGILPKEVLYRKKQGFNLPYDRWLRHELHDFADRYIKNLNQRAIFSPSYVEKLWKLYQSGNKRVQWVEIWNLVRLESWLQLQGF